MGPLELSVSQSYVIRVPGIKYQSEGAYTDPRQLFAVEFQLIAPDQDAFETWANGAWENVAPPTGPYAATIAVGAGQPAEVNPGTPGTYILWLRFNGTSQTPAFQIPPAVIFSTP